MTWEPIDITTPPKWHKFVGRRIAGSTFGFTAVYCPSAWYFGFELLHGGVRGIGITLGPVGFYVAKLVATPPKGGG